MTEQGKITDILQKEMQRAVRQKENVNILKWYNAHHQH